jgi:hypothetical protein
MLVISGLAVMLLAGQAVLVPMPEDGLARHLRVGSGMVLATEIGLRVRSWLEHRWGGIGDVYLCDVDRRDRRP